MPDVLALVSIALAIVFYAAGSIGLLRLPDLLSRLNALTKADNLGLGLLATGVALLAGDLVIGIKVLLVWVLVLAASASSSHLIARYSMQAGNRGHGE